MMCCIMWKRTILLRLIWALISSFFILSNFNYQKKSISLFSLTKRPTRFILGPHMESCCIMCTQIKQLVLFYSFIKISSIFFLSSSKTHSLWGLQSWNLIHTSEMYTKIKQPVHTYCLVFFLFLSLHLANINNLYLQNFYMIPLEAMAGGMWALLTICYIWTKKDTETIMV